MIFALTHGELMRETIQTQAISYDSYSWYFFWKLHDFTFHGFVNVGKMSKKIGQYDFVEKTPTCIY